MDTAFCPGFSGMTKNGSVLDNVDPYEKTSLIPYYLCTLFHYLTLDIKEMIGPSKELVMC